MTNNTRESQKIQTLVRIKDSALLMFAQHGLSISIAKIAEHAGISKQALMYHYPSKSQLLEAVIQDIEHSSFDSLLQFFGLLFQDVPQDTKALESLIGKFVEQHLWAVLFLRLVLENRESYLPLSFRTQHLAIIDALEVRQQRGEIKEQIDVAATFTNMNMLLLTTLATAQIQMSISEALNISSETWLKRRIFAIFLMYRSTLFP
jgi:TetR/AcrR family transcriptional regulator